MRTAFILSVRENVMFWTKHSAEYRRLSLKDGTRGAITVKAKKLHLCNWEIPKWGTRQAGKMVPRDEITASKYLKYKERLFLLSYIRKYISFQSAPSILLYTITKIRADCSSRAE
jgi:hypothetical protein